MNSAVERAIGYIWQRYSEPLTVADLATSAILSKHHFCRTFARDTGVSPGRFLSAVRIFQAKRLLLGASMNVTEISLAVGFNSLGSFTNHFTESVGISPGRFRRMVRGDGHNFLRPPAPPPMLAGGTVRGKIMLPQGYAIASVYAGVFRTTILQGKPEAATLLQIASPDAARPYELPAPRGEWFIHAVAVADTVDPEPWNRRVLLVAKSGPVHAEDSSGARAILSLRPASRADPPVLFALPELDSTLDQVSVRFGLGKHADAACVLAQAVVGSVGAD
jgi:AraC-like DNA-binding protein